MKNSKKTWLWEINQPDDSVVGFALPGPSFLFGTIHIRDQRAFTFLESALDYLNECEVVATEFNLDEAENSSHGNSLDLPEGYSLVNELSPQKLKRLDKLFRWQIGMPLGNFVNMHPFVLVSLLTESIMSKDMPMTLDQTIWSAGKNAGKKMDGLESFAFQMDLVQTLGLKDQIKMLKGIIQNFKSFRKKQDHMVDLYEKAAIGKIHQISRRQIGAFRKPLLYNRNFTMADRMVEMMPQATHFFAVGAGHLPGKFGLIRLLKSKGWNVRPVKLN